MNEGKTLLAVSALLASVLLPSPLTQAQDPPTGEPPAAEPPAAVTPAPAPEARDRRIGLFVAVAVGSGSADPFDPSIRNSGTRFGVTRLTIEDAQQVRAAVGWRLDEGKGDFRLVFTGFKEEEYEFSSIGISQPTPQQIEPQWSVQIQNGVLESQSLVVPAPAPSFSRQVADSLQNQVQTIDALYGREFGGRRFSSRWWGGLRYFEYTGNVLAGAWMNTDFTAEGYTNGGLLPLLNFSQDASGFGPTGSWEVDFNFFDKGVVLFLRGQTALTFNSLEVDSGNFFSLARDTNANIMIAVPSRLSETRDKSSWQNTGELGARVNMRNGLQFEIGYSKNGYLDVQLLPNEVIFPTATQGGSTLCTDPLNCSAANYETRDLKLDAWHAGVAFQF